MRFKTYGLYVRSQVNFNDEQGTLCCIEFSSFDDQLCYPLALDIRFVRSRLKNCSLLSSQTDCVPR